MALKADGMALWYPSLYPRDTADAGAQKTAATERIDVHPSLEYLNHIRSLSCLGSEIEVRPHSIPRPGPCTEKAEPHHLMKIGMGNNRKNPTVRHYTAVPLCRQHHRQIESLPLRTCEDRWQINLWKWAFRNYLRWLDENPPDVSDDNWGDEERED